MATSVLSTPHLQNEAAAFAYVEAALWPNGPVCPHCGCMGRIYELKGKNARIGLRKCGDCRKPFTVRMGTIFESSHLPLYMWLQVFHLMCASKKGIATRQIQRMLKCSMKTAWFLGMRIREAMDDGSLDKLGGEGKTVEIDETFVGGLEKNKHASKRKHVGTGGSGKEAVFSLVERGGRVRSHHVTEVNAKTLRPIITAQVDAATRVMSDEGATAKSLARKFKKHGTVSHSAGEYVRGEIHTNTIESYFAILKRGIHGVYHSVSQQHLHRYLAEFDFRYNARDALGVDDTTRADRALVGVKGKRLFYQTTGGRGAAEAQTA